MNAVIETDRLVKRFGKVLAVDQVSLHVEPGEIYGFLGLNGAGKTTTIRLLLGMVKSDAGEARMFGVGLVVGFAISLPPVNSEVIRMIGANLIITSCLTILLLTPIAFIASAGHGYLAPMAFALLVVAMAQFVGIAGWGEYFPWAIPALYAQGQYPGIVSFIIIAATGLVGLGATFTWWERADQTR